MIISVTLYFKKIKYAVLTPLIHIFNLSITSGEFPENMKLSKIIPLYKKGAKNLMENYRPISLLITLSKLLEKCMYTCLYNFLNINNIFYKKNSMASEPIIHVSKLYKTYMVTYYKIMRMVSKQL